MSNLSRRMLIGCAVFGAAGKLAAKDQETYRLRTSDLNIEVTIQFYDGYASRGLWFRNESRGRDFCLSAGGEQDRNCIENFQGSLAIAQYRIRSRAKRHRELKLREYVKTIDHDARLAGRPPFERVIQLERGLGSDLQAFGYEAMEEREPVPDGSTHHSWSCIGNMP